MEASRFRITRQIVSRELPQGESIDDVMAGGIHLAERRARLLRRESPVEADVQFSLSIWCYWPIKTPPPEEVARALRAQRTPLFRRAGRGDFTALDAAVPAVTLLLAARSALEARQRAGVASFLNLPPTTST